MKAHKSLKICFLRPLFLSVRFRLGNGEWRSKWNINELKIGTSNDQRVINYIDNLTKISYNHKITRTYSTGSFELSVNWYSYFGILSQVHWTNLVFSSMINNSNRKTIAGAIKRWIIHDSLESHQNSMCQNKSVTHNFFHSQILCHLTWRFSLAKCQSIQKFLISLFHLMVLLVNLHFF